MNLCRTDRTWAIAVLHPLQSALLPDPDVTHDQDEEKDQHFQQSEHAEGLEFHRPGEQEDGLHVEDHEQDGDNVKTNGITSPGIVYGVDAALVRHQLSLVRIVGPYQLGGKKCYRKQCPDQCDEKKYGYVVLWHP